MRKKGREREEKKREMRRILQSEHSSNLACWQPLKTEVRDGDSSLSNMQLQFVLIDEKQRSVIRLDFAIGCSIVHSFA